MSDLKFVATLTRKQLLDNGYDLVSDYESEFKITESFYNKDTNHRVCIKIVEEIS